MGKYSRVRKTAHGEVDKGGGIGQTAMALTCSVRQDGMSE